MIHLQNYVYKIVHQHNKHMQIVQQKDVIHNAHQVDLQTTRPIHVYHNAHQILYIMVIIKNV